MPKALLTGSFLFCSLWGATAFVAPPPISSPLPRLCAVASAQEARGTLEVAAREKTLDPEEVYDAIRYLEKEYRKEKKEDENEKNFGMLTGSGNNYWRLILTTGDMKTQKKLGSKLNYLPSFIKAVQLFRPDMTITNGVYIGSFGLLVFSGTYTWDERKNKLDFVFDKVKVLGFELPYDQGTNSTAGFTFPDVGEDTLIARGAGGGLALWLRQDSV